LVRIGEFVPTGNEDDDMIVHRSPSLKFGDPEVNEPPVAPLVVLPQGIHEARDIPTIPMLVRSIGQRYASRVIPREPCSDKLVP
jgi:hypothetical protein